MLTLPVRLEEAKPQVTAALRESLENTSILAKMRPGDDAKDFPGSLEHLAETENCPVDVEILIMPARLGEGTQPASGKEALEPAKHCLLQIQTHLP